MSATGCLRERSGNMDTGGVQGTASLEMARVTDPEISRKLTFQIDDGFLERVIKNRSVTVQVTTPPVRHVGPFHDNGTVYHISLETLVHPSTMRYYITIIRVDEPISDSETVAYEELPAVDRERVDRDMIGTETQLLYSHEERERSALVPTPDRPVIVWESDDRVRFTVRKHEVTQAKYKYTAETQASVEEFGAEFRRQHEWELTGLSKNECEIVEQAISPDGYGFASREKEPEATPTTALESMVARFRSHQKKKFDTGRGRPSGGVEGLYLVRYRGNTYWTRLSIDEDEFQ